MPLPSRSLACAALIGSAALILSSCGEKAQTEDPNQLATVGDQQITIHDLQHEWDRRVSLGRPLESKEALLEDMVRDEVLVQRALQSGLDQDPEVQRSIRALLIGTLKEKELSPRLKDLDISEDELRAAYEESRASFRTGEEIRLAIIHIQRSPKTSDTKALELKQRAEQALQLARATPDGFTAAAARFSDHQASRYRGGDLGWINVKNPLSRIPAQVVEAGRTQSADGAVSDMIDCEDGYYLVKRLATKPSTSPPLDQVADRLRVRILKDKRHQASKDFEQDTPSSIPVQLFPERLQSLDLPDPPRQPDREPPPRP